MKEYTKQEAIKVVTECSTAYCKELLDRCLLFVTTDKHRRTRAIEVYFLDSTQFRIILPNLNYENEIVSRLIENGEQDGVQEDNKEINHIADDLIGQVTIIEFLEYCKLPRTRTEMQEFCGLVARRSFNERYLNPLLEKGALKMTIPDKPRSKNQRYYSEL